MEMTRREFTGAAAVVAGAVGLGIKGGLDRVLARVERETIAEEAISTLGRFLRHPEFADAYGDPTPRQIAIRALGRTPRGRPYVGELRRIADADPRSCARGDATEALIRLAGSSSEKVALARRALGPGAGRCTSVRAISALGEWRHPAGWKLLAQVLRKRPRLFRADPLCRCAEAQSFVDAAALAAAESGASRCAPAIRALLKRPLEVVDGVPLHAEDPRPFGSLPGIACSLRHQNPDWDALGSEFSRPDGHGEARWSRRTWRFLRLALDVHYCRRNLVRAAVRLGDPEVCRTIAEGLRHVPEMDRISQLDILPSCALAVRAYGAPRGLAKAEDPLRHLGRQGPAGRLGALLVRAELGAGVVAERFKTHFDEHGMDWPDWHVLDAGSPWGGSAPCAMPLIWGGSSLRAMRALVSHPDTSIDFRLRACSALARAGDAAALEALPALWSQVAADEPPACNFPGTLLFSDVAAWGLVTPACIPAVRRLLSSDFAARMRADGFTDRGPVEWESGLLQALARAGDREAVRDLHRRMTRGSDLEQVEAAGAVAVLFPQETP